nr:hypothetical protein [uncultured Desulfobacter sp.]
MGEMISRKQKELTYEDIEAIAKTYHSWRPARQCRRDARAPRLRRPGRILQIRHPGRDSKK